MYTWVSRAWQRLEVFRREGLLEEVAYKPYPLQSPGGGRVLGLGGLPQAGYLGGITEEMVWYEMGEWQEVWSQTAWDQVPKNDVIHGGLFTLL